MNPSDSNRGTEFLSHIITTTLILPSIVMAEIWIHLSRKLTCCLNLCPEHCRTILQRDTVSSYITQLATGCLLYNIAYNDVPIVAMYHMNHSYYSVFDTDMTTHCPRLVIGSVPLICPKPEKQGFISGKLFLASDLDRILLSTPDIHGLYITHT